MPIVSQEQPSGATGSADNWRKEFLQGGFFGRKRSGSTEELSSISSNPTTSNTLSSSDSLSSSLVDRQLGTWKMIKGRVSQAMEDIKSSKGDSVQKKSGAHSDGDSDVDDYESDNESDTETRQRKTSGADGFYSKFSSAKKRLSKCKINKSSENSKDSLLDSFDREGSPLRSSFLFKKKKSSSPPAPAPSNNEFEFGHSGPGTPVTGCGTPVSGAGTPTASPMSDLRRRHYRDQTASKGDLEIESGIEITEEMSLNSSCRKSETEAETSDTAEALESEQPNGMQGDDEPPPKHIVIRMLYMTAQSLLALLRTLRFTCVAIFVMNGCSMSEFWQGFICSSFMALDIYFFLKKKFGKYHLKNKVYGADKVEIKHKCSTTLQAETGSAIKRPGERKHSKGKTRSSVTEFKQLQSYSGWMNEIKAYDPFDYHCSLTRTVFVKLDGSRLRVSSYLRRSGSSERVSKRAQWNDPYYSQDIDSEDERDKKNLSLSQHRYFNLLGSEIRMLPIGLARKRYADIF